MKELKSFGALARAFKRNLEQMNVGIAEAMETSAVAVVITAREEIGHYQRDDMGPANPWQELAPRTKRDRVNNQYPENEPLLRDGTMRDSIEYHAEPKEFVVGSNDEIAFYQEIGTDRIPPRPFLIPALFRNIPVVIGTVGEAIEQSLSGEK